MSESFELFSGTAGGDDEDDYEYERMTSSEVLEKLEEVGKPIFTKFYSLMKIGVWHI